MNTAQHRPIDSSPYQSAVESAISDFERAQQDVRLKRNDLAIAERRSHELFQLIEKLLTMLPIDQAAGYRARAVRLRSPGRAGRGTTVTYDNVIDFFAKHPTRQWSPSEMHQELSANGTPADPDQIHSVFQYLLKKGRLKRESRGRYSVIGYG